MSATENLDLILDQARELLPESVVARIEQARDKAQPESELIAVLHLLQAENGYLGEDQLDAVAQLLRVPTSTVSGVATFYHYFRLDEKGQFMISVCTGTACYVKGADKVVSKLQEELGIHMGETTSDGLFSLVPARCLGMCGLAPVLTVNEDVYDRVTPDDVPKLLKQYTDQAKR